MSDLGSVVRIVQLDPKNKLTWNDVIPFVDAEVTHPEQFTSMCLIVIPIGFESTPSEYTEGSDFWVRPYEVRRSGATLRDTRISGVSKGDDEGAIRCLEIGY